MKYMQAHLVNQMNDESCDQEKVAAEWEKGCDEYHNRMLEIEKRLPESVQAFLKGYCLHDADLCGRTDWKPQADDSKLYLYCRDFYSRDDGNHIQNAYTLEYDLEQPVALEKHWGPGFHEDATIWLYDEFDIDDQGRFVHNILFSNGLEASITFKKMTWFRARIEEEY